MNDTNAEHILHDVIYHNITLKDGIKQCRSRKEVFYLIRKLDEYNLLSEFDYEEIMSHYLREVR